MALLGRILGAAAGRVAARQLGGVRAGPAGAVIGAVLPVVLRRFGPAGMIGAAVGGYLIKKITDAEAQRQTRLAGSAAQGRDTSTSSLPKFPPE